MNVSLTLALLVIGGILIIALFFTASGKFTAKKESNDPRRHLQPNATNYNQSMFTREELENMSKEEAQNFLDQIREGSLSSLSPRDFAVLKEKLNN